MTVPLFSVKYALPVIAAILLALFFPVSAHMAGDDRRRYWRVQIATLIGAGVGAKVVVLMGDRFWPVVPLAHGWIDVIQSGRSIVGGLIFGFIAAELAKPVFGYTLPPNDRFAAVLPFSAAIGRVGCFLQGCCRGIEHHAAWSVTYSDGIPRYPVQLFEAAFHLAAGLTFVVLVKRRKLQGRLFALYLIAYGIYRFLSEIIRETPRVAGSWSVYQFFCIVMVLLGVVSFALRKGQADGTRRAAATPAAA
jgi:prolipoprotein diacylglyceryltransferase